MVRTFNVPSAPWAFNTRYITLDWNSFLLSVQSLTNGWNLNCLKTSQISSLLCLEPGFMNQRWHLDWVTLHILFFCELVWKPSLFEKQHVHKLVLKSKDQFHLAFKNVGVTSLQFLLWTLCEKQSDSRFQLCFSHHIISGGLCATLVSGTSPEMVF